MLRDDFNIMMVLGTHDINLLKDSFLEKELNEVEFVAMLMEHLPQYTSHPEMFVTKCVELFRSIDVNGDGSLDWSEFSKYIIEAGEAKDTMIRDTELLQKKYDRVLCGDTIGANVLKMDYIGHLHVLLVLENDSNCIDLLSFTPTCVTSPRPVSKIVHHTMYKPHIVHTFHYAQQKRLLATSSILESQAFISFWNISRITCAVLVRQIEVNNVQTIIISQGENRLLTTANLLSVKPSAKFVSVWDMSTFTKSDHIKSFSSYTNVMICVESRKVYSFFIITGSSDGMIAVYDYKGKISVVEIHAHENGVKDLAYSAKNGYIASIGQFNSENKDHTRIAIWNMEKISSSNMEANTSIGKRKCDLSQNNLAIQSLQCVDSENHLLSMDIQGTFYVFNSSTLDCFQTYSIKNNLSDRFNCCCITPKYSDANVILFAAGDRVDIMEFKEVNEEDVVIYVAFCTVFNRIIMVTHKYIIHWNALSGNKLCTYPTRGGITTAACMDDRERKLFLGDANGDIFAVNLEAGTLMKRFDPHDGEISSLCYCATMKTLISTSIDSSIRISNDNEVVGYYQPSIGRACSVILSTITLESPPVMLSKTNLLATSTAPNGSPANPSVLMQSRNSTIRRTEDIDVTQATVSCKLDLIASCSYTGQSEPLIHVWDYARTELVEICSIPTSHKDPLPEVTKIEFWGDLPILSATTNQGTIFVWGTRGCASRQRCVAILSAGHGVESSKCIVSDMCVINVDKSFGESKESPWRRVQTFGGVILYSCDSYGYVSMWYFNREHIKKLLGRVFTNKRCSVDYKFTLGEKRYSTQVLTWEEHLLAKRRSDGESYKCHALEELEPELQWEAHDDGIATITCMKEVANIITSGKDGHVRVWNSSGTMVGQLVPYNVQQDLDINWELGIDKHKRKIEDQHYASQLLRQVQLSWENACTVSPIVEKKHDDANSTSTISSIKMHCEKPSLRESTLRQISRQTDNNVTQALSSHISNDNEILSGLNDIEILPEVFSKMVVCQPFQLQPPTKYKAAPAKKASKMKVKVAYENTTITRYGRLDLAPKLPQLPRPLLRSSSSALKLLE